MWTPLFNPVLFGVYVNHVINTPVIGAETMTSKNIINIILDSLCFIGAIIYYVCN